MPPISVPSLQNMALLLDKLAKENQDIRLLQAQLQVGTDRRGWVLPVSPKPGVHPKVLPGRSSLYLSIYLNPLPFLLQLGHFPSSLFLSVMLRFSPGLFYEVHDL